MERLGQMTQGTSLAWARNMQRPHQPAPPDKGRLFVDNNGAYINEAVQAYLACAWWADSPEHLAFAHKEPTKSARAYAMHVVSVFCKAVVNQDHNLTHPDKPNFISADNLGHNLWLSQQGHGTGFWDVGGEGRPWDEMTGEALHAEARTRNAAYVWVAGKYFNIE